MIELPTAYDELTRTERRDVRERYMAQQGGLCWYCQGSLKEKSIPESKGKPVNKWRFPDGFFDYPVHLHHDHDDGLTIGAVHAYCNAVSFDYDESPLGQE